MDRDLEELRPFPPLGPAVKVLMVWPRFPASYWSLGEVTEIVPERSLMPPLGLITVAALCMPRWWPIGSGDARVRGRVSMQLLDIVYQE
jgi:hypothetical protein